MMDLKKIESLLFVAGNEGITIDELAILVQIPTSKIYDCILKLKEKYELDPACGLHIMETGNQFILSTKREMADLLKEYAQSPISNHLSQAAVETLAIVAYKQPITRSEIDEIRGVQSSGSVQKLVARHLIEEKDRVDGPGRAILYGTTSYFMNYFGLKSIRELPSIEDMEEQLEQELPSDLFFDRFKKELESADELEIQIENKTIEEDEE